MNRNLLLLALFAAAACVPPTAHAAEPASPGPVATVRVAFDRDGITNTRVHGLADKASGRRESGDGPKTW